MNIFGLVSLFYGISTIVNYLMPKPSLLQNNGDTIQFIAKDGFSGHSNSIYNIIPLLRKKKMYI